MEAHDLLRFLFLTKHQAENQHFYFCPAHHCSRNGFREDVDDLVLPSGDENITLYFTDPCFPDNFLETILFQTENVIWQIVIQVFLRNKTKLVNLVKSENRSEIVSRKSLRETLKKLHNSEPLYIQIS